MKIAGQQNVTIRRLSDLGKWYGGKTPSKAVDAYWTAGTVPWVSPKDMKQPHIIDSEDRISERAVTETGIAMVPKGAVLMVIRSGILAHTFPVAISDVPVTINQDLKALHPNEDVYAPFVAHYLKSQQRNIINACAKGGTTVPSIDTKSLHDVAVPLPPPEVQRDTVAKIEELFSDLDAGVAALKRAQANLKRYRAAVLKAAVEGRLTAQWRAERKAKGIATEPAAKLLDRILAERRKKWEAAQLKKYTDAGKAPPKGWRSKYLEPVTPDTSILPELPNGWRWATMSQLSERFEYGTSVKCGYEAAHEPVLRIPNIVRGDIDLSDLKFSSQALNLDDLDALQVGDMLVCRTNGSISLIGKTALIKTKLDKNYSFASYLLRFRFVLSENLPAWVNLYMVSFQGRKFIESNAASSAGQHNISLGLLSKMRFPLPSLAEQTEIVAQVEAKLSNIAQAETEIKRSLERAARLRQAILKRAFEGRLI